MKNKQNVIMVDQKGRLLPLTTYIHDESVVKGKKTALLLCLILIVILIWSSYVN